jgi:O-antigen ligase
VVGVGLWQNYQNAQGIYGETPKHSMPSAFFGPFFHFTSAGAFINLCWPIAASLSFQRFGSFLRKHRTVWPAIFWAICALWLLVGHAGHVSRFPQFIAVIALLGLGGYYLREGRANLGLKTVSVGLLFAISVSVAVFWIVGKTGRLETVRARWQALSFGLNSDKVPLPPPPPEAWPHLMRDDLFIPYDHSNLFLHDRGAAYLLALKCFYNRPIFGYGPGGWMAAASQNSIDPVLRTFFHYLQFTHQDYLQTMVEWGFVGTILVTAIIFGGLLTALKACRTGSSEKSYVTTAQAISAGAAMALSAVLIQSLIDFPLQIPANAACAAVLVALCWSANAGNKPQFKVQTSRSISKLQSP